MSGLAPSWADVRARWSASWRALGDQAVAAHAAAIRANPTAFAAQTQAFTAALGASRQSLDAVRARMPNPPATPADQRLWADYSLMERRYHDLAAGFYADASPGGAPGVPVVGVAPVLVVGGLAIGVAAIAWAIVAYEYASNLRDQTALAERELSARIAASESGRTLPPSTLPPPPAPASDAMGAGLWLIGGLALAAGALTVPLLLRK